MRTLVTWSDRGASGPPPSHQVRRPTSDRGPVMRFIEQPENTDRYQRAIVLTTTSGEAPAQVLVGELGEHIFDTELHALPVRDPTDFEELFRALENVMPRLARSGELDILLSAGTPQMQTLWVILVKSGLLGARLLQVIPSAFVPSVHPKAIREVVLDIEGFPEIRALRDELVRLRGHSRIVGSHLVGRSRPMQELAARIGIVAPTEIPVLIQGETGTGKELVARSVHESSHRAAGPLIAENCGALTETVLASELFGHEKGAFTGASHRKRGLFELAHGGTLFLDEVGELSPRVQVNLLRVLQSGTLRRLGGETEVRVDVRIIAASHRELLSMVREGTFREDLYYRLQGATLIVPPLRQRIDDLEALISHFQGADSRLRITREAWRLLEAYPWPGNVRELRAEVMRWQVFCDRWVRAEDLDPRIAGSPPARAEEVAAAEPAKPRALADAVADTERVAIRSALDHTAGNLSRAARLLQVDRNTLKRKIQRLGIDHERLPAGRPADAPPPTAITG